MHLTDKGLIIGFGVIATIGIGVLIGKSIAKKKKAKKEENKVNFEEQMEKQYNEEKMTQKTEEQLKDTNNLFKEAGKIVTNNPVTREDLAEMVAKDPEFAKNLAKYVSPVQDMSMKHMPSIQDIIKNDGSAAAENFKNEIGLNNTYNRSESIAGTTKHVKDYNRGLEYDVKMPIDSVNDISNIKPLKETKEAEVTKEKHVSYEEFKELLLNDPEFKEYLVNDLTQEPKTAVESARRNEKIADFVKYNTQTSNKKVPVNNESICKADTPVSSVTNNQRKLSPEEITAINLETANKMFTEQPLDSGDRLNLAAMTMDNECKKILSTLSEDDQIAIARRLQNGEPIHIAGKYIGLFDLPILNQNPINMSNNVKQLVIELFNNAYPNMSINVPKPEPVRTTAQEYNAWINQYKGGASYGHN